MRDDISTYIPPQFRNFEELRALHTVFNKELKKIKGSVNLVLNAAFVTTADENGIAKWEKDYDLPSSGTLKPGTLKQRQERVLSILRTHTPFSMPAISLYLNNFVGQSEWSLQINHLPSVKNVSVRINRLSQSQLTSLIQYFDRVTPLDYGFEIAVWEKTWNDYLEIPAFWNQLILYTWVEVVDGVPYQILKFR